MKKLDAYIGSTNIMIKSHSLFFADNMLEITIAVKGQQIAELNEYYKPLDDVYRITININDIKTITWTDNYMIFEAYSESISVNNQSRNHYELPFDFNKETNIALRVKKAFVHYAKFFWKPVKNEAF